MYLSILANTRVELMDSFVLRAEVPIEIIRCKFSFDNNDRPAVARVYFFCSRRSSALTTSIDTVLKSNCS